MGILRPCVTITIMFFLDNNKVKITQDLPVNLKFLKINQYELEINSHLKLHVEDNDQSSYNRSDQIVVTYGHKGCKYMGKMYPPSERVITQDLSGAGDTFFSRACRIHHEG